MLATSPDEVLFWFESDLYDQLQLVQAVALMGRRAAESGLAQFDLSPDGSFAGLSELDSDPAARPVRQAASARASGGGICPQRLGSISLAGSTRARAAGRPSRRRCRSWPRRCGAIWSSFRRWAPGLSRTEQTLLEAAAERPLDRVGLFHAQHERERRPFMGDAWVWRIADRLEAAGLLETVAPGSRATSGAGVRSLAGELDRMALPAADRWLGGVHVTGPDCWRWDPGQGLLRP